MANQPTNPIRTSRNAQISTDIDRNHSRNRSTTGDGLRWTFAYVIAGASETELARVGAPSCARVVPRPLWLPDRAAGRRLAGDTGEPRHAHLGADGFRQNAGGFPGMSR